MSAQEPCQASTFLTVLLDGCELSAEAARALYLLRVEEERLIAFGSGFNADRRWSILLTLYVAEAGLFQLATDVLEMIGCTAGGAPDDPLLRQMEIDQLIRVDEGFIVLTAAAVRKTSAVLGTGCSASDKPHLAVV